MVTTRQAVSATALGLVALGLLAAACAKPDLEVSGMDVFYNGHPELDRQLQKALPIILFDAQAEAHTTGILDLASQWCVNIQFQDPRFSCDGAMANGCWFPTKPCDYLVGWHADIRDSALTWELAHGVWQIAYGNPGEYDSFLPDGGVEVIVDPFFQEFVDKLDNDVDAALKVTP